MSKVRKIGTAVGTFGVALGIGFVMQNGDALASRFGADSTPQQSAPFTNETETEVSATEASQTDLIVEQTEVAVIPAQAGVAFTQAPKVVEPDPAIAAAIILPQSAKMPPPSAAPVQLATLDPEIEPVLPDEVLTTETDCVPTMAAMAGPAATISLTVFAPCHVSQSFTVHHQGMMFTAMTNDDGEVELTVPALAEVSVVIAAFSNGDGAVGTASIPDFKNYDRAVLQWQGATSVMLSAYENDANFGDEDHINADNPGDMDRMLNSQGGYLVQLGDSMADDALMAEVYTFPTEMMAVASDVLLAVEAEITAANCGQELSAQSIQVASNGQTAALDLTLIMPDCDAVGDFLILQNMFKDLTLASR